MPSGSDEVLDVLLLLAGRQQVNEGGSPGEVLVSRKPERVRPALKAETDQTQHPFRRGE